MHTYHVTYTDGQTDHVEANEATLRATGWWCFLADDGLILTAHENQVRSILVESMDATTTIRVAD